MTPVETHIQRIVCNARLALNLEDELSEGELQARFAVHPNLILRHVFFDASAVVNQIEKEYGISLHTTIVRNHSIASLAKYIGRILERRENGKCSTNRIPSC